MYTYIHTNILMHIYLYIHQFDEAEEETENYVKESFNNVVQFGTVIYIIYDNNGTFRFLG